MVLMPLIRLTYLPNPDASKNILTRLIVTIGLNVN